MASRIITAPFVSGEDREVPFDFAAQLPAGQTISSAVAASSVYSGTDASPTIVGTCAISGSIVTVPISDGTEGVIYDVKVTATLSGGDVVSISTYVAWVPGLV